MPNYCLPPEEQFIAYYDTLREELNTAYLHYEIAKLLQAAKKTHREELSEALTFFELTMLSNFFSTILSIGKFIDKNKNSLCLDVFFGFVKDNLALFTADEYRNRLLAQGNDNEYCEDFVRLHKDITDEIVDKDKETIKELPIDNLRMWRHKKLAHIEEAFVTRNIKVSDKFPIQIQDIDKILVTFHEILDRYRIAYDGIGWMIGTPPVKYQIEYIFNAINFCRKSRNK